MFENPVLPIQNNFEKYAHIESELIIGNLSRKIPKFDIVIPTYKRSEMLKKAIESCLNQNINSDFDIIIVDNCPEENSSIINYLYSLNCDNIYYYKNKANIGMFGNWNRCFEVARSEWVCTLHDDDRLCDNYLQQIERYIEKFNFDALYCQVHCVSNKKQKNISINTVKKRIKFATYGLLLMRPRYIDLRWLEIVGSAVLTGSCHKRNLFLQIGGFDDSYYPSADWAFSVNFVLYNKVLLIKERLLEYNIDENTSSMVATREGFIKMDYIIQNSISHSIENPMGEWYRSNLLLNYADVMGLKWPQELQINTKYNSNLYLILRKLIKIVYMLFR